jgi:hypothetical protein
MSCEPLKKLLRKRTIRPSSDFGFARSSGFCCAEAWFAKTRTKTLAITTARISTAATNERYAMKKKASASAERSVTTFPRKRPKQTSFLGIAAPDLNSMRMTAPPHTRRITYETAVGRGACVERI